MEYQFGFGGLGVVWAARMGSAYGLPETGTEMDAMRLRLIGEIEARHGARIEVLADAFGSACTCWTRGSAAGRRAHAPLGDGGVRRAAGVSGAELEEEERDNACDKAGFLSFMEYGVAFDLRGRLSSEWRLRPLRTRSTRGTRLSARAGVWLMCPCTWVRCCLVFSVLFGGLLGDRE